MALIQYATKETATARSAELWAAVRGPGWQPGNVTQYLYGTRARTGDAEADAGLPVGVDAVMVVSSADASLTKLVLEERLTSAELVALVEVYPAWKTGGVFVVNDLRSYNGNLYRCNIAHTNYDPSHTPNTTANLWTRVTPAGVIPAWVQPTGAHDAYALKAQVTHKGRLWESQYAANVWEPGVFGWKDVGAA